MGEENDADEAGDVAFEQVARFVSVVPAAHRFYELRWQATLWGGVALVRAWGWLGTPGRSAVSEYPDHLAAGADIERAMRRRRRRGYRLVAAR